MIPNSNLGFEFRDETQGLGFDKASRGAIQYSVEVDYEVKQDLANSSDSSLSGKNFIDFLSTRFGQPKRQDNCKSAAHT